MTALSARLTAVRKVVSTLRQRVMCAFAAPPDRHLARFEVVPVCPTCGLAVTNPPDDPWRWTWIHVDTRSPLCHDGRPGNAALMLARPTYVELA